MSLVNFIDGSISTSSCNALYKNHLHGTSTGPVVQTVSIQRLDSEVDGSNLTGVNVFFFLKNF